MELFFTQFQLFSILFARLLAIFSLAPFFSGQGISFFHRVALAFVIGIVVTPVTPLPNNFNEEIQSRYYGIILEQVFIGFFIAVALQILFSAFQMAGEFFSVQMGFGVSQVFDPMAQTSLPLMGSIKNLLALFVFFVSGSHLWLIQAVVFSYQRIPYLSEGVLFSERLSSGLMKFLVLMSSGMFIIALKIALPVMGSLFLTSVTLGMLSKAAPQMNILMLGFPLKILIAFLVLMWSSPIIVELIFAQFDLFFQHIDSVIKAWPN